VEGRRKGEDGEKGRGRLHLANIPAGAHACSPEKRLDLPMT